MVRTFDSGMSASNRVISCCKSRHQQHGFRGGVNHQLGPHRRFRVVREVDFRQRFGFRAPLPDVVDDADDDGRPLRLRRCWVSGTVPSHPGPASTLHQRAVDHDLLNSAGDGPGVMVRPASSGMPIAWKYLGETHDISTSGCLACAPKTSPSTRISPLRPPSRGVWWSPPRRPRQGGPRRVPAVGARTGPSVLVAR